MSERGLGPPYFFLFRLQLLVWLGYSSESAAPRLPGSRFLLRTLGLRRRLCLRRSMATNVYPSLLLLPSPPVGGRQNESQALNGPAWSLMQEYLGNIAYALILRRLRALTLAIIFGLSGLLLIWTANAKGSLDGGWDYPKIWMAPLRLTVSFVMGLWLYRVHDRIRIPKIGLLWLSIVLIVCFQMPVFPRVGPYSLNGLYDAACVLFLFPLILFWGAHSDAGA